MLKRLLTGLILLIFWSGSAVAQSAGIYESYIVLHVAGEGNLYYDLNANTGNYDFNGEVIGTFCEGSTNSLMFKGGEHKIYKCNGCDLTSTRIYYRLYITGTIPGSFVSNELPWASNIDGAGSGCQNQLWTKADYDVDLLSGLAPGDYTMEVYSDATVTCQGGTVYASNNGSNYKAYFTVAASTVGGTVSSDQSVCTGNTPGELSLTGNTGSVLKWQRSTVSDFSSEVTDIANTTTTLAGAEIGSLTTTTYIRAVVQNGVCADAYSSVATLTVNDPSVGGSLSSNYLFCSTTNSGTFTLTGNTGNVIAWQSSPNSDFSSPVTEIANTTDSYSFTDVATTTYYRAVVQNGGCSAVYSSVASVTVASNTWTGLEDDDWQNANNWCGGVPGANDEVVISNASILPVIKDGETVYAGSLTLQSGGVLEVESGGNLIVTNSVQILPGGNLTIDNNGNLIQVNNVANSGIAQVTKSSSALYRLDYTIWSSPVEGQNLMEFSPYTLATRFYDYDESLDIYTGLNPEFTEFQPGYGYLIRMPNNHFEFVDESIPGTAWNGTFYGTLNNGNISVPVTNTLNGYNLVGNPYPSSINIHDFYDGNSSVIESGSALYFWRKRNDLTGSSTCYATVTMAAYTANTAAGGDTNNGSFNGDPSDWVINPGQGFFVKVDAGTAINFTNSMRVPVNNEQFFRTIQDEEPIISRLWLNLTGDQGTFRQAAIAYNNETTLGIDYGWDGRAFTNDGAIALYTTAENEDLAVQARGNFVVTDVVPVGYKVTTAGSYTISLDHFDGLFEQGQDIYLKDNLTDVMTNLKEGNYSFSTDAGTLNDRFEVWYMPAALGTDNPVLDAGQVVVYQKDGVITIDGGILELDNITIFDTRGRLLYSKNDINNVKTEISDLVSQQQMLIINITTERGRIVKKILH